MPRPSIPGIALAALLVFLLGHDSKGCGGEPHHDEGQCGDGSRADTFVAGLSKSGDTFTVSLAEARPAPPAKGDNTWTLEVRDGSGQRAGLPVTVVPFMPDHGHGTPVQTEVTDLGGGRYEAAPVNLWMPGLWEVGVSMELGGGATDEVVFAFCIEG